MEETQQVVTSYDLSLRGDMVKYTLIDFLFAFRQSDDLQQRIFSAKNFAAAVHEDKDSCFKDSLTKKQTKVLGKKDIQQLISFSANEDLKAVFLSDDARIQKALDDVGESEEGGPGVIKMSVFLGLDQRKP